MGDVHRSECACACHDPIIGRHVEHGMPCCLPCPKCRRYVALDFEGHVAACKEASQDHAASWDLASRTRLRPPSDVSVADGECPPLELSALMK